MGHRLSKIYTRTGDDGTTGLGDGSRAPKDHARVEAYGTVDELNSTIGVLLAEALPAEVREALMPIQHELFDLGSELCIPGRELLCAAQVTRLETTLDLFNESLTPLKEFILPGGARASALAHVARTVCRRTERRLVTLTRQVPVNPVSIHYVNRLSDLLFVIARYLNIKAGAPEVLWQPNTGNPSPGSS